MQRSHLEALSFDVDAELALLLAYVESQVEVVKLLLAWAEGDLDGNPPMRREHGRRRTDS